MADEIITKQELIDAKPDVKNLGEAANGNETGIVTPRYGAPYSTAPAAIQKIEINGANAIQAFQTSGSSAIQSFQTNSGGALTTFQNNATAAITKVESTGGLISVPTLTALQAITSAYANQSAIVEATGAYYRWNADGTPPAWVATGRNFLTEAASDAQTKADAAQAAAISTAAADVSTKATAAQNNAVTAANTNTDNKFTAYMTGTQVLVKNYAAADFSVIDSFVQSGIIAANNNFNRTDYIAVKSGDVINFSAYLPTWGIGSVYSSDYTYIADVSKTVNGGSSGYSTGTYTAAQDGFIVANHNKTNASYANPTITITSKDRLVANSNLNTSGSALGYTKYISQLGGTDLLVDALFTNTNLAPNTSVYSTFGGAPGDFDNKFNQGFRIYSLPYTALVSLPIPVYAGTRIKGKVARSPYQQSLLILDANKKPLKFLDDISTSAPSLQTVDLVINVDGYLVIQHHSVTLQCDLRLFGKTKLLNSDMKDKPSGYVSYEYYLANVDKKTELDVTTNVKSVTNIDRVKINSSGAEVTNTSGWLASNFITCLPNLTFTLENIYTKSGVSLINFYDASYNFITGMYSDDVILSYQRITSPENTAFVRFCVPYDSAYDGNYTNTNGTVITAAMAKFKLVMNASGVNYYTNYLLPMLNDLFLDVRGDSIGQGIANALIDSKLIRSPTVRAYAVGGENVLDTLLRAGVTSVEMRTNGITVPADGTAVTIDAYFDFTRTVTYNADGTYANSGGFRRANWGGSGTNVPFEYDGQKFYVNLSSDTTSTIRFQTAQSSAYTFTKDTAFSAKRGTNKGLLFVMMGTNGGFGPTSSTASFDNLLMMHKRLTDAYLGKCIVAGYYYTGLTNKAYFRKIMEAEYGERFVDFETHILTRGLSEMQITLNAEEKAFIAQYQGLTTGGGNSALPFFSGDNTHPGGISYRCFTNEMLRRAYLLGFIDKLYQLDLQIPTAAMITTVTQPAASIAVGATTIAKVGLNGSDAYLFEWTSSNPSVASVPTRKWTPPNANYGSWSSIVITGVSAGTATITCKCRHGGATKTFDITVN
ncbi:Ig-like domain-containing protein [Acinetobacter soli]|uniref:Ig-like domain-containing protein n=1 Tax=Acinetobacter soli TaxID=487316 RepID=UPI002D7F491D|nr:Ig-like domain-containing protein [Acinetobacter soli]MEB4800603.1 Ig-like domain-containing protein [Acinetobacter soli]